MKKIKDSLKYSNGTLKPNSELISDSGSHLKESSNSASVKPDIQKAKAALTKEQLDKQRQMSIISFQPHTLFDLKGKGHNQMSDDPNFS